MSARLRFQDILNSRIPVVVGDCDTSTTGITRMKQWASAFEARALQYGRWFGTTQLAQFCVQVQCGQACIVWPREIAVFEAGALNGIPINGQNMWGQFIRPHVPSNCGTCCGDGGGNGCIPHGNVGWRCGCGCGCGIPQLQDEGWVPSFSVVTTGDVIRTYFNPADVGRKIVFQGKNSAGVWVRSTYGGMVQDGEEVTLATTSGQYYTDTTNTWLAGAPTGVFKDVTDYRLLVYAHNADGDRQIADYAPTETNPAYRKSRLVGAWARACCGGTDSTLRAIVSLQNLPITQDNDWLLFTNLAAYQDGMLSEKYRENGDIALADAYFFGNPRVARNRRGVLSSSIGSGALASLQAELRKQTGDVTSVLVQRDGLSLAGFI